MGRPKKPRKVKWTSRGKTEDLGGQVLDTPGDEGVLEAERAEDFERHGQLTILGTAEDPRKSDTSGETDAEGDEADEDTPEDGGEG